MLICCNSYAQNDSIFIPISKCPYDLKIVSTKEAPTLILMDSFKTIATLKEGNWVILDTMKTVKLLFSEYKRLQGQLDTARKILSLPSSFYFENEGKKKEFQLLSTK